MHLTSLHLLLTYRCTYECDHCFVYSSPRAEGTMSLEMAKDAISQAAELSGIHEIWFEGGEPFLYYPVLLELVRFAGKRRMKTGVVTNAFYAVSEEDARVWLEPLRDAGLKRLSVSDDRYHNETFPSSPTVSHLISIAKKLGIVTDTICIAQPGRSEPPSTKGEPISGGPVRFRGRAVEKLAPKSEPSESWESLTECPDEDWISVGRLHLDPYGNLFSCQGTVFGNLLNHSLTEIVANYSPEDHPIVSAIHHGGPAELVRRFHLPLRGKYHDACHLCYAARRQLRERFPAELGPSLVYGQE